MRRKRTALWIALGLAVLGLLGAEEIACFGVPGWAVLVLLWSGQRRLMGRFKRLGEGRLIFVWGLATALLWGTVIYEVGGEPDLNQATSLLAFAGLFAVFLWALLFLSWGSWSLLAAPSGASVLAGGLVAPLVCSGVIGLVILANDLAGSELLRRPEPTARNPGFAWHLNWRRPQPGDWDLVNLSPEDANPGRVRSAYERAAAAVVEIRGDRRFGTGFLVSRDGLALTNHHVVFGAGDRWAVFGDGTRRPLRVVRWDRTVDVALVQIDCREDCPTVELGSSERLAVGSDVAVVGTPRMSELKGTVTRGVLSGRRFGSGATVLQFDAPVSPGNSGGPIIDPESGRVVGVVSSKFIGEAYEGLGFGLAIEDVLRVLGVRMSDVAPEARLSPIEEVK